MSILLALEASSEHCSVALRCDGVFYERYSLALNQHNAHILPMIDEVLRESGRGLNEINAFAFGCGPGSFTGLRIASAVVQALALSCDKPVIAVSSLAALAQAAFRTRGIKNVFSLIDARMAEVYWAIYRLDEKGLMRLQGQEKVDKPAALPPLELSHEMDQLLHAVGSGCCYQQEMQRIHPMIQSWQSECFASARDVLELALVLYEQGAWLQPDQAQPVYLREQISWKKLPGR